MRATLTYVMQLTVCTRTNRKTHRKQINKTGTLYTGLLSRLEEEHYKENRECTFNPDPVWGESGLTVALPVINPLLAALDPKSLYRTLEYRMSLHTSVHTDTQPKNKRMQIDTKKHKQVTLTDFLFKVQICNYHLEKFIYQKTVAENVKLHSVCVRGVSHRARGLGRAPRSCKGLVPAHNLFTPYWATLVWGPWFICSFPLFNIPFFSCMTEGKRYCCPKDSELIGIRNKKWFHTHEQFL